MNPHPPFPSMPFMEAVAPLLRLFKGMSQKGPGGEASTLRALSLCPLPAQPSVADLGCGAGASTLVLARTLRVPILALDADGTALDDLWAAAQSQGLLPLVHPRTGDLGDPPIPPGSLDLLWSEGAIAHVGWRKGLAVWKDLLRPGGVMAFTDATWFREDPPPEAQAFWRPWYPTMGTEASNLQLAREAGLEVVGHFRLPARDWWAYFDQVAIQCGKHRGDETLAEVIALMEAEVDLYRRHGDSYGYVFYLLRRA
ncbi:SAM-dependent methyltransferase [Mesoterricola silvestris]|uniref:Methyltransferase type 11 n=1 Tax=Mesoterricola silvestris TaxID=2927979 RepID=A0AA48KAW4_9BACT|nr:class I SAM-dependent methyltransferase [Mesoterricola silvestris]BDU73717.1 methyltransferase type 11 [Mesoterricola silvestris]